MVTLEERLKSIDNLPTVSPTVAQLMTILSSPQPDAAQIEAGFSADPALSMAALRMANSAYFAGVEHINSVKEATLRLGKRNLMKIVMLHFTASALRGAGVSYGLGEDDAWKSGLAGAIAAEWIAENVEGVEPAVAFTASLLRDCGKLVMDHLLEEGALEESLAQARRAVDQITFEKEVFELDHAEVGAALAKEWGIAENLQEAIRFHHHPPAEAPVPLIDVVYASDMVSTHLGLGVGVDGLRYQLEEAPLERISFDRKALSECMYHTLAKLSELEEDSDTDSV